MAENHRFMTYTQIEKTYRKILSRRVSRSARNRQLAKACRRIILAFTGNAPRNGSSDSLTLLRQDL